MELNQENINKIAEQTETIVEKTLKLTEKEINKNTPKIITMLGKLEEWLDKKIEEK